MQWSWNACQATGSHMMKASPCSDLPRGTPGKMSEASFSFALSSVALMLYCAATWTCGMFFGCVFGQEGRAVCGSRTM